VRTFKAMAASIISVWGSINENIAVMRKRIKQAKAKDVDLLLLPECCLTGADWPQGQTEPTVEECGLKLTDKSVQEVLGIIQESGIHVAFGLYEKRNRRINITQVIAGPDGIVGSYRKTHEGSRSSQEKELFPVFDLPFARIGVSICYDNMFPECSRILALKGAEVLLSPFTSLPLTRQAWQEQRLIVLRARALDNRLFVLSASHAEPHVKGKPEEWGYSGICCGINPLGEVLEISRGKVGRPQQVIVTFKESDQAKYTTADVPALWSRRPVSYMELVDPALDKKYRKRAGRG
jgi:predicted amidohydrolase